MPWLDAAWQAPAWIDGDVLPFDGSDRGLLLGDGVFDTSLVLNGQMVWRAAHVTRLLASCRELGFEPEVQRIETAIDAVLPRMTHGSLRITVTRGPGPRGLSPPATARPTITAAGAALRAAALFTPIKLHLASIRRNETSPLSRLKTLCYLDGVLATRDAIHAGSDDALFLNTRDRVACTSVGNIFAVLGSALATPPASDGVLHGTVRGVLLRTGEDLGLEPVERSLTLADLANADAVFCTNSLRLVTQVVMLDRKPVADSPLAAALTAHVAKLVEADVGVDPRRLRVR